MIFSKGVAVLNGLIYAVGGFDGATGNQNEQKTEFENSKLKFNDIFFERFDQCRSIQPENGFMEHD